MKIVIFNWRDIRHPLGGGAEISLFEHAKYWHRKKNDVIWFASSFSGASREEIVEGVRIIRKGSAYTVHFWAFFYYIVNRFGRPDIVIDSFHFIPFFTSLYIPRKKIIALINEVAGKIWFDNLPYLLAFIGYHAEPFFFKFYKNIPFITGSESARDEVFGAGILSKNITVIHHGISVIKVGKNVQKEKRPALVFLGRISADKGIKEALDAFIDIKNVVKNAELWILGKEEKKGIVDSLLKGVKIQKIKKSIKYFGFVSEEKKFELLKRSWVLIHPSKKEGWGLNVIEAGIVGTPTVGYNVEGLKDSVQNEKTGILVDPQNSHLLTDAVIRLINDKNLYTIFSQNVIKWSESFSWDKSVKKSWELIRKHEVK